MRCPQCQFGAELDRHTFRCPVCDTELPIGAVEELEHLAYLREWLSQGCRDRDLSERRRDVLLHRADAQIEALKLALGLGAQQTVAAAPCAVTSMAPSAAVSPPVRAPAASDVAPAPSKAPRIRPSPRPTFSWAQIGTYLLSERTLHALLGLGAFLILASGVVISILNPTGLGPLLHLTAVMSTTLLFYAAGYVIRQRLHLALTGAALLAIGGAFIPLCIWTLGQELLHWQPAAIWLLASMVSLPIYLASHVVLRDRTFGVLVAVAGGSEVLALANWFGVPLEWGLVCLIGLGCAYLWLARRLDEQWATLAWALAWSAQICVPVVMLVLLSARFFPSAWQSGVRTPRDAVDEYAVGAAWWLGAGFFALASTVPHQRWFRVLAIWTVPIAYLLTLTKAPWDPAWHAVALAVLAAAYLLYGHWRRLDVDGTYQSLAAEPVYQVAMLLTLLAAAWPNATTLSQIVTLLTLSVVYGAAAEMLQKRICAYVAVYLLPIAFALLLDQLQVEGKFMALAWTGAAIVLLGFAEFLVRRTAEYQRPLLETIVGRGIWRSQFASPLFSAGYLVGLAALRLAWLDYWNAPAQAGIRQVELATILAFLALVALATLSSAMRQTSFFLFIATWLFLIPFNATVGRVYSQLGLAMNEAELARLLAFMGIGYLLLAYWADRFGGHYAKPFYLVGYFLSLVTMPLSVLDRAINTEVVALSILVYAASAWLVHSNRHPSFTWTVAKTVGSANAAIGRNVECLFMYLAAWLFPVWLLLAMSLASPAPTTTDYGIALAVLAPIYAAIGLRARNLRPEYRWPWYLAGYALSVIGPLVALAAPSPRLIALSISVALYAISSVVSRKSTWLYPVALLTPVLVWQAEQQLGVDARFYGLTLILEAVAYVGIGVLIHHRSFDLHRAADPVRAPVDAFALPFFVVGFGLCALGLSLSASQDGTLVVLAFSLASALFAASAYLFRLSLFAYPMLGAAIVAYVVGITLTNLNWQAYGLALIPGMLACLAGAEVFRRGLDAPRAALRTALADRWSTPFYATTYLGTLAVPIWSTSDQRIWAAALWAVTLVFAVSVILFRRPAWLYPMLAAGLIAFVATEYAAVPDIKTSFALGALVAPAATLFAMACGLTRSEALKPTLANLVRSSRILLHTWSGPLVVGGWVSLLIGVEGSLSDPFAGFCVAATAAVALGIVATLWRGHAEAWASLSLAALAYQQAIRGLDIPIPDQPARWAFAGLGLGLLAIGLRRKAWHPVDVWTRPAYVASMVAGGTAVVLAMSVIAIFHVEGLRALSATLAINGLTLVAHGFDRRERILNYQGVGLLLIGYMLQLALFDVGQPQAFALPAGMYLLVIAYLEWRRGTDHRIKALLETAALVLLLGVTLIQSVGFLCAGLDRYVYATFLLLESVALFGLGAALHWRRSFVSGALALVLDVFILLADPLRAMNTWYLVAIIGLAMIAAVVFIEQQRQRIPFWLHDWRLRLETWD
jgi:hypothetical protein